MAGSKNHILPCRLVAGDAALVHSLSHPPSHRDAIRCLIKRAIGQVFDPVPIRVAHNFVFSDPFGAKVPLYDEVALVAVDLCGGVGVSSIMRCGSVPS